MGLIIELLLPVALSAAVLLVLAGYTSYWDLHTKRGLTAFGVLLVALSSVLSLRLDTWTSGRRRARGKRQLLNRAGSRSRLMKLVLGGVVIPIAALVAANLFELPNRETPMAMAIRLRVSRPPATREEQLGNAILRAERSARVQGIRALQTAGSGEALAQLLRILREDPEAASGGNESQALSTALASYGVRAKPGLLKLLSDMSAKARRDAAAAPGDLFDRHFSAGFDELRREIDRRVAGPGGAVPPGGPAAVAPGHPEAAPDGRLEVVHGRLAAAEDDLKRTLSQVELETRAARDASGVPGLVMQAFLQMNIREDGDLLAFARNTAADANWSDPVRGQALLLIAKLGGKDDLDALYGQLESPSPVLQERAMRAIAGLQSKLTAH